MRNASLALAVLVASAYPASAAEIVTTFGGRLAHACYQHARANHDSRAAVNDCTSALDDGLSRRDRAATLINRGIVFLNRRDYTRALNDFDRAVELQPDLAEGHLNRAAALRNTDDAAGAVVSLNRALELGPREPALAYYNRGIAHEDLGEVRAAYQDYRRATELAPDWDAPRAELARFRVD